MNDLEMWQRAVAQLEKEYLSLPSASADGVAEFLGVIRGFKKAIHRIVEEVNGGQVCALCLGECCVKGKYHVTAIDVLAYFVAGKNLFVPAFSGEHCPYLGAGGCMMEPEFRPFNCVTFNCERIEGLLEPHNIERFYLMAKELKRCYEAVEKLLGRRFMHGLLMNYVREVLVNGGTLLAPDPRYSDRRNSHGI